MIAPIQQRCLVVKWHWLGVKLSFAGREGPGQLEGRRSIASAYELPVGQYR